MRSIRPQKAEPHRMHMIIGGNILDYDGSTKSPMEDIITMKLILNSVISTPGENFMTMNINISTLKQIKKKNNACFFP